MMSICNALLAISTLSISLLTSIAAIGNSIEIPALVPFISNYYPEDYLGGTSNYSISIGSNNLLYIANQEGYIEYDGHQWRFLSKKKLRSGTSIHFTNDRLYYFTPTTIGYLDLSTDFYSHDSILHSSKDLGISYSSRKIHEVNNKIYFMAKNSIHVLEDGTLRLLDTDNDIGASCLHKDTIWVQMRGKGLYYIVDDQIKHYSSNSFFFENNVYDISCKDGHSFLLSVVTKGLFQYGPDDSVHILNEEQFLAKSIALTDGSLIYSTLTSGILNLNSQGEIQSNWKLETGLCDNNIFDIELDKKGNIWTSSMNGLSHILIARNMMQFNPEHKLPSQTQKTVLFEGKLFIGTKNGLFSKELSNAKAFKTIEGIKLPCVDLKVFKGHLFISTSAGLYVIVNNQALSLHKYKPSKHVLKRIEAEKSLDYTFLSSRYGALPLVFTGRGFRRGTHQSWMEGNVLWNQKDIFWSTTPKSQFKYRFSYSPSNKNNFQLLSSTTYQKDSSFWDLPDPKTFLIEDKVIFAAGDTVFRFNERLAKYQPDSCLNSLIGSNNQLGGIFKLDSNKLLIVSHELKMPGRTKLYLLPKDGSCRSATLAGTFPGQLRIDHATHGPDSLIWFSTNQGLVGLSEAFQEQADYTDQTYLRSVFIEQEKTTYRGNFISQKAPAPLTGSKASLQFKFSWPNLESSDKIRYAYRLKGLDENWSSWGRNNAVRYSNLEPGSYEFQVKGMDYTGNVSLPATYAFSVKPIWYKRWWMYFLYIGLLAFAINLIIKWRIAGLKKAQLKLEKTIEQRTLEVQEKNEELISKAKQLEEANKHKSEFFANISHEFRTPLTLIMGPLKNIISNAKSPSQKEDLQLMYRQSEKLKQYINQLLELSKIENNKQTLSCQEVSSKAFILETFAKFESLAVTKSIEFSRQLPEQDCLLSIDKAKMEIALNNIVSNALKFTPTKGQVSIIASCQGETLTIGINDTGIGIPPEEQEKVFERFYQAETGTTKKYEGTGIGLSLAKELIELHGGSIELESQVGKGSNFIIKLPCQEANEPNIIIEPASNISQVNTPELEPNESAPDKSLPQVLLIDDNEDMLHYINRSLELKFSCHTAKNGAEGLAKAQDLMPDLIVSDVMMPEMDGFELTKAIKTHLNTCHIPVVLLTAKASSESKLVGLEFGADDYLYKPFSTEELIVRCQNLIQQRSLLKDKFKQSISLDMQEVELASMDQKFILKLGKIIEERIMDPNLGVEELSTEAGMSRRHLQRKIGGIADMSPSEFIRSYRLKKAAQLLKQKASNVSEVAYAVGFNDLSYFSKCFKKQYNCSPSDYH